MQCNAFGSFVDLLKMVWNVSRILGITLSESSTWETSSRLPCSGLFSRWFYPFSDSSYFTYSGPSLTRSHADYRNGLDWNRPCVSPDGNFVGVGGQTGGLFLFSVNNGRMLSRIEGLRCVQSDLYLLVLLHKFPFVLIEPTTCVLFSSEPVSCCAWMPNGDGVVMCGNDDRFVVFQ